MTTPFRRSWLFPPDYPGEVMLARYYFLACATEMVPKLVERLRAALPRFRSTYTPSHGQEETHVWRDPDLLNMLREWVREFHLQVDPGANAPWDQTVVDSDGATLPWTILWAIQALDRWRIDRDAAPWEFAAGIDAPLPSELRRLHVETNGWNPAIEDRDQAGTRMRRDFEAALKDHFARVREAVGRAGWSMTRVRRQRKGDGFPWLVQRQILGKTYSQIARRSGATRQGVQESVLKTAALVGIALRPSRPGRPR